MSCRMTLCYNIIIIWPLRVWSYCNDVNCTRSVDNISCMISWNHVVVCIHKRWNNFILFSFVWFACREYHLVSINNSIADLKSHKNPTELSVGNNFCYLHLLFGKCLAMEVYLCVFVSCHVVCVCVLHERHNLRSTQIT